MMETVSVLAGLIFSNANNLSINVILCIVTVYALWRMHWFEKKHDREFSTMRSEHKQELKAIQDQFVKSIDKLTTEIENSNKERAQITNLLSVMKDGQMSINHALNDYDLVLNEILIRLGSSKSIQTQTQKNDASAYQNASLYGSPHIPKRAKLTTWSE